MDAKGRGALRYACAVALTAGGVGGCNTAKDRGRSGSSVDRNWADWPPPNSSAEVAAGAPHPASYTDRGDGTVIDNVTRLMWQKAVPGVHYTWESAQVYCAGLALAGHTDWRLPTYVELVSLVDFGQSAPAIDATYFPKTPADFFWSSTPVAGKPSGAWFVNFATGSSSDYPHDDVSNAYLARCVR